MFRRMSKTSPECPRCKVALSPDNLMQHGLVHTAWFCGKCKGAWISLEQLQQAEQSETSAIFEWRSIPSSAEQQAPLACPDCGKTMAKVENSRDRKVTMDVCDDDKKVWLDRGELEAIRTESLASSLGQLWKLWRSKPGA